MKKIKYISILLLVFALGFISCKKTHDMPPVQSSPAGGVYTIAQLRALYHGSNIKFTQDISVYATVTMTDNYKTLYIRDNSGAISLRQLTAHGIFEGDSLRINLNGSTLDLSGVASSLQIDSVDVSSSPTNKIVKLAVGKQHPPINVSVLQLNNSASSTTFVTPTGTVVAPQSMYDGQLVQVNGVQFAYTDSTLFIPLNNPPLYLNHALYDCGNINTINMSLYSGTYDFLYQKVPHTKSGSIIAAVTFYNGALQLTPRSFADINLTQPRCGVDTLTQNFASCIASSNFATALPGWYNVAEVGSLIWTGNGSFPGGYPAASNYQGQTRNVMWLVSPPIQNSPTKNVNFQWSLNPYTSSAKPRQLSVLISTNFNGININGLGAAHWTDVTSLFSTLSPWIPPGINNYFFNANTNPVNLNSSAISNNPLAGYTGTFYIGFRYMGNNNSADSIQTFAIDNFALKN